MKAMMLALALAATLFPLAAASNQVCTPDHMTCVNETSSSVGSGDCSASTYHHEENSVTVYNYGTPLGFSSVKVSNACHAESGSDYSYAYNELLVSAYSQDVGNGRVSWVAYSGVFGDGCSTTVGANTLVAPVSAPDLGCPTGSGPGMILPPTLP